MQVLRLLFHGSLKKFGLTLFISLRGMKSGRVDCWSRPKISTRPKIRCKKHHQFNIPSKTKLWTRHLHNYVYPALTWIHSTKNQHDRKSAHNQKLAHNCWPSLKRSFTLVWFPWSPVPIIRNRRSHLLRSKNLRVIFPGLIFALEKIPNQRKKGQLF